MSQSPEEPLVPATAQDDEDEGWGERESERTSGERDADFYERERPPHHGD